MDDLEPEDWKAMMDDVIEALREQPTAGSSTPPDMRDKRFRASFLSFWRKLARACTLRQHNIRDGTADAAIDSTVTMLVYLSSSSVYQVREYCTSAGLELGLEVSALVAELTRELELAKGRLTGVSVCARVRCGSDGYCCSFVVLFFLLVCTLATSHELRMCGTASAQQEE